ncbi:carotenoid oxygenase family protein [Pseudonocardia kunmingensis]|uniref:Dioxygenase n=1 Tax=Pseudonocardia kunmingensis TaxID=630975 RepID=A0A543E1U7_9PSEU|nr:carotenoid oxygenase family protein [Pseudonocardia kunmingensis]TQM15554.1 carotenoid cleavage dioxygenase [Pseudonocardia kunmingensis]
MTGTAPPHLMGHLAPVADEIDAVELPVDGALPRELTGRYLRNGPNPLPGEVSAHWFAGHGMVHGVRLRDGRAEWYRNRWVRTAALEGRSFVRADGTFDHSVGHANTHVIEHAGRIMALVESSFPHVLTPELDTVGPDDFGGRLTTAMTAHPKTDPVTGELHFFGYGIRPPFLTYHRLSADGELVTSAEVAVPGPTMMHDFAITDRHAVFLDLPMTFQPQLLAEGMPFGWDDAYGARLGVMPLDRPGEVRWFDVEPSYVFHVGNAHTDAAGRVVLDAARYGAPDAVAMWGGLGSDPAGPAAAAAATGTAHLHRWVLDPVTGAATETALDDRAVEFPTVDDARVGREARYRYAVADSGGGAAIIKFDAAHGARTEHDLGGDTVAGEAVFVPSAAPDRAEDDGWLLSITTRRDGSASQLLVLDATDVAGPPVAAVTLPRGVPSGFHGSWIDDAALARR